MKRVLRTTVMALLVTVLCAGMLAPAARADASEALPVNGTIQATIHSENLPPEGDTVAVILTGLEGAPMPEGAKDGVFIQTVKCTAKDTAVTFTIPYDKLGIYHYTVSLSGGANDPYLGYQGTFDEKTVYDVTVSVVNNIVNGAFAGYVTQTAAYRQGAQTKCDVEFTNSYVSPEALTVVKKWVGGDRASSVQIALLCDGVEYDTVTLSASNDWQHKWENLNPLREWSVKEVKVPAAYTVSYRFDQQTGVWTVTNTTSLLQTGQLNWPIPVLVITGIAVFAVGLYLMLGRRKKSNG